jgi:hypothetical protein
VRRFIGRWLWQRRTFRQYFSHFTADMVKEYSYRKRLLGSHRFKSIRHRYNNIGF